MVATLAAWLPKEGDGMDEPTDPLARQLALTALTTEHFNLQTARMGTIAEANGRSTLYLGALSSATIAIAFVGLPSDGHVENHASISWTRVASRAQQGDASRP